MIDAAVKRGLTPPVATQLVVETIGGTAALLAARDGDTLAVRREVASPGGVDRQGARRARAPGAALRVPEAIEAVMGRA